MISEWRASLSMRKTGFRPAVRCRSLALY